MPEPHLSLDVARPVQPSIRILRGPRRLSGCLRRLRFGVFAVGAVWGAGLVAHAESGASPAVQLRAALRLAEQERFEEAIAALDGRVREGPLQAHAALLEGRWWRTRGELERAERALRRGLSVSLPRDVAARLWMEVAQVELSRGRYETAREAQEQAWRLTHDPALAAQLAFELARALEDRKQLVMALELYRTVWTRWPKALEADDAFERSSSLERRAKLEPAPIQSLVDHIRDLRAGGRCDTALELLPAVRSRKDLTSGQARMLREEHADCLFRTRRYSEATKRYRALAAESDGEAAVEASIQAARARVRSGQQERGVRELSAIARSVEEPYATRARYLVALLIDRSDPESSRRLLEQVANQGDDERLALDANWQLAWAAVERDDSADAMRHLEPLMRGSWSDIEVRRARYWHAVVQASSSPELARQELRELAEAVPLTYYGMLAAERLGLEPELQREVVSGAPSSRSLPEALERAGWLQEAGLPDLARDELTAWRLSGSLTRDDRLTGALALHQLGEHYHAARLVIDGFGDAFDRGIDPNWREAWTAAWYRPFGAPVERAVKEFEFDEALVYAIMREESLYRPEVQSGAGARGLMQLVPPTAKRIATTLGVSPFDPEYLYEPAINVRFGTFYLKQLTGQFKGSRPLAIAAYNAGPEAVSGWTSRLQADVSLPVDRFVDSVPYNETRRYLRRVLRSYQMYRLLYGDSLRGKPAGASAGAGLGLLRLNVQGISAALLARSRP